MTVIVPALNAERTIEEQLAALVAQTYQGDWELVVSDNGSTDRTLDIVRSWTPRLPAVRIVDSSDTRGVAHARNVAAQSGGDLLVFCDADDVVEPTWLAEIVDGARDADIVGGALEHEQLNESRFSGWRGGATSELPRTYDFLPYALGGNCAVRQEAWATLGGWSLDYPRGEDVDFCWRAQLAGFRLAFAPRAVIHCRHRGDLWDTARQVYDYAKAEVRLLRDFDGDGARRRTARQVADSYLYLLIRLPYLVLSQERRGHWVVSAASNLGRLAGSVEYRVFAP